MVRSAWRWLLGAPNRGTHKNKVNEIRPDIRKIAGLPIMRSLIEPLGRRQAISLICQRRLLPNTRQFAQKATVQRINQGIAVTYSTRKIKYTEHVDFTALRSACE